jgi:hypothetical protein
MSEIRPKGQIMKSISKLLILPAALAVLMVLSCAKKANDQGRIITNANGTTFEQVGTWEQADNRIYTVFVSKEDWAGMEEYGGKMPYKSGRTTSVLFFKDREATPDVTKYEGRYHLVLDRIFADGDTTYWVARYDHWPSGESIFRRMPVW